MGVAKSDFSQMRRSRSDLIKNAECFARIDLNRSRFEKECNQCTDFSLLGCCISLGLHGIRTWHHLGRVIAVMRITKGYFIDLCSLNAPFNCPYC